MDITEVSIVHHIAGVLLLLWACSNLLGYCPSFLYFLALLYLYQVNAHYYMRLQRRLQFEERKAANQKKLLSNTESVRWLNHAIEKIWPICMEQIASQHFLLPVIPWFLEKYKPWTVRKAAVQNLYLGRRPPMITDMRVLGESSDDDHLVLELGMNFLTADDMSAVLSVQLAKSMGFGISANMHITSMHVEGRVLVGVKFLRQWPFIGRVRICFIEPPYFQMAVKPIIGHGVDVTELPGVSGWLDKLLGIAFGETLVEPNMLVIDVEKFVSSPQEGWFEVKEKPSIAYVKLEILEGADMKPSDLNGLADPYVKVQLGPHKYQTQIQRKTLFPKWQEEFNIPISSWESPNVLVLQVRDKDHVFDDLLGDCKVEINDLIKEQRHDMWLPLENIKMGRIRLAITVVESLPESMNDNEKIENMEASVNGSNEMAKNQMTGENQNLADEFEPIDIEGQERTGIWVHRPGSNVSQTWEPRKGRARPEMQLHQEDNAGSQSRRSSASDSQNSDQNENDGGRSPGEKKNHHNKFSMGFNKMGSLFRRSSSKASSKEGSEKESPRGLEKEVAPIPRPNAKPGVQRKDSVKLVADDDVDRIGQESTIDEDGHCSSPQNNTKLKNKDDSSLPSIEGSPITISS